MNLSRRRLGLLLGALPLLSLPAVADAPPKLASMPISRMDLAWWKHRFEEKQARLRQGRVDLLFIGDSITQQFEQNGPPASHDFAPVWDRFYGNRNAVNLGFVGDTTANLLWRLRNGELDGISPRAAIVLIGANNLGRVHWGIEPTLAGIDANLSELRTRTPRAKVLLLSVLPSDRGPWVAEMTAGINRALAATYGQPGSPVTYVDVTGLFTLPGGAVDTSKFIDPTLTPPAPSLHPNAAAMAALAQRIEPQVATLMG